MIKKPQIQKLSIQTTNNHEDFSENIILHKRVIEDQNDNTQKFLYAFEKPIINLKINTNSRQHSGRLSAFDFFSVNSNKANQKKAFSIALNYFKNEERKPIIMRKPENLYGFSKVSSRLK
ncbi:unnamed protein product [Paramecium sonneborni]|uniref:Uncharacterized protein n=1 Tax=Paramecium sonneborni TaxID=65129 RepID=A0A8S1LFW8_9CILI|nr:unnamed protein product [Paramecium sonneborni]